MSESLGSTGSEAVQLNRQRVTSELAMRFIAASAMKRFPNRQGPTSCTGQPSSGIEKVNMRLGWILANVPPSRIGSQASP